MAEILLVAATIFGPVLAVYISERLSTRRSNQLAEQVNELTLAKNELEDRERTLRERADALTELIEHSESFLTEDSAARGRILYLDRRFDEAISVLSRVISREPTKSEALYFRALSFDELRKWQDARRDLEELLRTHPDHSDGQLALARTVFALRDFDQAEREAQRAIDLGTPDLAEAWSILGDARREQGLTAAALTAYQQCLDRFPKHTRAIVGKASVLAREATAGKRSFDDPLSWLSESIKKNAVDSALRVTRADVYLQRGNDGDVERAMKDLADAVDRNPRDARAWGRLGKVTLDEARRARDAGDTSKSTKMIDDAERHFVRGLDIAPRHMRPTLRNELARIYESQGRVEDAVRQTEIAVVERPDYVQNHMSYVTALLAAGRWDNAATSATKACELEVATRSPGGRKWLRYFALFGYLLAGRDPTDSKILDNLSSLVDDLRGDPPFDPSGWDWSPARAHIESAGKALSNGASIELISDLLGSLDGRVSANDLGSRWLRGNTT